MDDTNNESSLEVDPEEVKRNKIINEEYKIWRKNAPALYDVMFSRCLDWPTLTAQWFPDKQQKPGENIITHRLLIGTHTSNTAPNYLEILHLEIPDRKKLDPADWNEESGEIGGYGASKKALPEFKLTVTQKIDHDGEVNKARYMPQNPDLIATFTVSGKVCIFDRTKHPSQPTGRFAPNMELLGHTEEGYGLHWNPNKEGQLVTGSFDKTVKVWDIQDFTKSSSKLKPTNTFTHHSAVVNDVEFHPMLPFLIGTVSDDQSLQMLDLRTGKTCLDMPAKDAASTHTGAINSIAFNWGSEYVLATGSADKTVAIWDLRHLGVKSHACEAHHDEVQQVEWHPHKKYILASSSSDRRLNIWDLSQCGAEQLPEDAEDGPPELMFMHGGHTDRIADFDFNKNDPWLMCSASEDNIMQIWTPSKPLISKDKAPIPLSELQR